MDNSLEINFDWSSTSNDLPIDSMDRARHAKNLTKFLTQKGKEANYVLNLNAKWGTGKTFFLRRWANEIQLHYPTVYIDAWSSDRSSDPLLSVVSEIKKKLHELHGVSELEANLFAGVAKAVKASAPAVVKAFLKAQFKKHSGMGDDDIEEIISTEDLADVGSKLVEQAIDAHNKATVGVEDIKRSIQEWLASVIDSKNMEYPLFIFIDELDRCRPTYAIEMLETIKHIFDMKNVVFIIATDKEQLEHSIKAIYGTGFDSRLYLDRFFSRTITLDDPSCKEFIRKKLIESNTLTDYIKRNENYAFLASEQGREHEALEILTGIADGFSWPLRKVNLWLDRLEASIMMTNLKLEFFMLSFMMALETDDNDWLKKYQEGLYIFKSIDSGGERRLDLKNFLIATQWSFSQIKDEISNEGYNLQSRIFSDIRSQNVSFFDFLKSRMSALRSGNINSYDFVVRQCNELFDGGKLDTEQVGSGDFGCQYYQVAFKIYDFFHYKNAITFRHYMQICRYASLID